MKKKLLSIALTLSLCLGLAPTAAAADPKGVKQIEAGAKISFVVTNDGTLYGCGLNSSGHNNQVTPLGTDVYVIKDKDGLGYMVSFFEITDGVNKVASSKGVRLRISGEEESFLYGHSLILKENGQLYGLGDNSDCQLGQGNLTAYSDLVHIMDNVVDISCGKKSSFAIDRNGDLYFWGVLPRTENETRSLGYSTPTKVLSNVKSVAGGGNFVVALKNDGSVWTMGSDYEEALGNGNITDFQTEFGKILDGMREIAVGDRHGMALSESGELWVWGSNSSGQLGVKPGGYVPSPQATGLIGKSIECGPRNSFVAMEDGRLNVMGDYSHGQLGLGGIPTNWICYNLDTKDVATVSAGMTHTLMMKTDGTVYACGSNDASELGLGNGSANKWSWTRTATTLIDDPMPFDDVPGSAYFYTPVLWAVSEKITSGTSATTFSPNNTCTRAQIITLLWNAAGAPVTNTELNYTDVKDGDWYANAIRWAVKKHILPNSGEFSPNAPCTRAETVEFMWKYAGSPKAGDEPFTDVNDGDSFATAVAWALEEGITAGTSATTFGSAATCTRAQIATFLYKAFG